MNKGKKNNYSFLHSPVALIILFLLFIFFAYKIIGLIQKERETAEKKELILDQIEELHKKEASLALDIAKIETEEGKEEIIREKYQVAKKGEKVVVIVDEEIKEDSLSEENEKHGLWNWLKGIFNN